MLVHAHSHIPPHGPMREAHTAPLRRVKLPGTRRNRLRGWVRSRALPDHVANCGDCICCTCCTCGRWVEELLACCSRLCERCLSSTTLLRRPLLGSVPCALKAAPCLARRDSTDCVHPVVRCFDWDPPEPRPNGLLQQAQGLKLFIRHGRMVTLPATHHAVEKQKCCCLET